MILSTRLFIFAFFLSFLSFFLRPAPALAESGPVCDPTSVNISGSSGVAPSCSPQGYRNPWGIPTCGTGQQPSCADGYLYCKVGPSGSPNLPVCWPKGPTTSDPSCPSGTFWGKNKNNSSQKCCIKYTCLADNDFFKGASFIISGGIIYVSGQVGCSIGRSIIDAIGGGVCSATSQAFCSDPTTQLTSDKQACEKFAESSWALKKTCLDGKGVETGIGCIPVDNLQGFLEFVLKWAFFASGGIIVLMVIATGYTLMTSQGNPEKLQAAKENIVALFSGLILIAFSLVLLQAIGADILKLPTF